MAAELVVQVMDIRIEICAEVDENEQTEKNDEKTEKELPFFYSKTNSIIMYCSSKAYILYSEELETRSLEGLIDPPDLG
jgi:hypothetical protein